MEKSGPKRNAYYMLNLAFVRIIFFSGTINQSSTNNYRAGSRPMQSMQMHRSEKRLPMHSSVRFLPQIMRINTL